MGKHKRKFINKKNAVTFHLVHRSQHDPLITDENAPQHVLVETKALDPGKRREEQRKYGIFFDDDYDYLQHLKEPGGDDWDYVETSNTREYNCKRPGIQLPSSVFASTYEEDVGLLNKAAPCPGPKPEWDPDVVAALDGDFNFDDPKNQLEDDFFIKAMDFREDEANLNENGENIYIDSDGSLSSDEYNDEMRDRLGTLICERKFVDDEVKSRFTDYSMSSSVIKRNEQLTLLDDKFEKLYETYYDSEVGALDLEEIEGFIADKDPLLLDCGKELKQSIEFDKYKKEWDKERIKKYTEMESSSDEVIEVQDNPEKIDCESILSTYSNIYNHPKLIKEASKNQKISQIQIDLKTGIPKNVLRNEDKLTVKSLAKFNNESTFGNTTNELKSLCENSILSTLSVLSIRPKDEELVEKRQRKKLLRQYRSERRMEKKANTAAFKEEKKKQEKAKANNQINIQGNRLL